MDKFTSPRRACLMAALSAWLVLGTSVGRAGPLIQLNFVPGAPTITGSNGTLSYNAATGDFQSTTTIPLLYSAPSVLPRGFTFLSTPQLTIDLMVDKNGNYVANGSGLVLTGSVMVTTAAGSATFTGNTPANPLLSGPIIAFGEQQPAGPAPFVFSGVFDIQGGALTQTMGAVLGGFPIGSTGGFLLEAENTSSGILGNFSQSFSSSSVKPLVAPIVPEPAGFAMGLIGAATMAGWAALRHRHHISTC